MSDEISISSNISETDIAVSKAINTLRKPVTAINMSYTSDFCVAARAYMNTILAQDDQCRSQFEEWVGQKKQLTEALNNDRGMSQMEEMKFCLQLPELLGLYLFKQFPEILDSKDNMYKFMKAFPEFTVPKAAFKTKYDSR